MIEIITDRPARNYLVSLVLRAMAWVTARLLEFMLRLKSRFYLAAFTNDLKASVTVFFVALPLCLGISLASGTPVHSGLWAGIIGGLIIPLISKSVLSVSGPAAGLTAISAMAITKLGAVEIFFLSVSIAGLLQVLLGLFRLGGFTHLIPSSVIKGMLTAIGLILIGKQIPLVIGYDKPDFWEEQLVNLLTFRHGFENISGLQQLVSPGVTLTAMVTLLLLILWERKITTRLSFLPAPFVTVLAGSILAWLLTTYLPSWGLQPSQFVNIPEVDLRNLNLPDFATLFSNRKIWESAVVICFVASLETLLSIEAVDKIDPQNRITPQNRELLAQGIGNFCSGLMNGIPVTSVIVRSSANVEAGGRSRLSSFLHGLWLLLAVLFAAPLIGHIPYCVLAVILIRTGYGLAKPSLIKGVYLQGREQFIPFIVTIVAILLTDLLIGVFIGIGYAIYFLIKHTYRAGYTVRKKIDGHTVHFNIDLALNVSFLNKKRIMELLEGMPEYSIVEINGEHSVYIDHDILEIFEVFKTKASTRHIQLMMKGIPPATTVKIH